MQDLDSPPFRNILSQRCNRPLGKPGPFHIGALYTHFEGHMGLKLASTQNVLTTQAEQNSLGTFFYRCLTAYEIYPGDFSCYVCFSVLNDPTSYELYTR